MSCLFVPLWWLTQALCPAGGVYVPSFPMKPSEVKQISLKQETAVRDPIQWSKHHAFAQDPPPYAWQQAYTLPIPALKSSSLSLLFVGDVLLHQPQHQQALRHDLGHLSLWESLIPTIEQADIAYANLEGPMAYGVLSNGRETTDPGHVFDKRVYSSYPLFNYHGFLADDLKRSGFDVVSTANNHALDRSSVGVDKTITELKRVGLAYTGTRPRHQNQSWATRVSVKGWVVSFVACTEHTNGMPDPHHQVLKCNDEVLKVIQKEQAHPEVDLVIVTPHWGEEYQPRPHAGQTAWAQKMIQSGADAIVGSHPHVVQTVEWIEGVPVVYSLGNFVSSQFHRQATQEGLMVRLDFKPLSDGRNPSNSMEVHLEEIPLKMTRGHRYEVIFKKSSNG